MSIDKTRVARRFNRHAATYDRHAHVQSEIAERLVERLPAPDLAPARILELGCGTGYLTELLARRFPDATISAIDLAENMADATRARLAGAAPGVVDVVVGDVEEQRWKAGSFGLVASSATIQWLSDPAATLERLARALAPGGLMIHATFGPRTFEELFEVFGRVETSRGLPQRQHGLTLRPADAWTALLAEIGLDAIKVTSRLVRPTYESCRSFLAEVRATGASYNPGGTHDLSVLSEVMRCYDAQFGGPAGVAATYDVIELSATRL
jgi:malonyl-CoA O-methyltransferase